MRREAERVKPRAKARREMAAWSLFSSEDDESELGGEESAGEEYIGE